MVEILYIKHSDLTTYYLEEIVKIKAIAWPNYSYAEHSEWIEANIKNSDIHVLYLHRNTLLSYLNLIDIDNDISVDEINSFGFGIGNVCARERGRGWGKNLVKAVNEYLDRNNKLGLLFCKELLVKFYIDNDWMLINDNKLTLSQIKYDVRSLGYNLPKSYSEIKYTGIIF